jgi:mRNA-degrading endonuclease RelE of RelBE toxin-antitoxin system
MEIDIYEQRSKQLKKLIAQRRELIQAAGENLDELIDDINTQSEQQMEPDF